MGRKDIMCCRKIGTLLRHSKRIASDLPGNYSSARIHAGVADCQNLDTSLSLKAATTKATAIQRSIVHRKAHGRDLAQVKVPAFEDFITGRKGIRLDRLPVTTLQLNVGLYCNQACSHCHVESSPQRTEMMSRKVADRALELLRSMPSLRVLDLTGGAPELNTQFRYLVEQASRSGFQIIDRCNLTVLEEPGQEDLADFLATHKVKVVASLPCYEAKNVQKQRGSKVFQRSIAGLRKLNAYGYGMMNSDLELNLVHNPLGASLPSPQHELLHKYKRELLEHFGIHFNNLYCITNMPIKRFADSLYRAGKLQEYMDLLVRNFNPQAIEGLMCRTHLSVGWDGRVYDCDFNQQLGLALRKGQSGQPLNIFDINGTDGLPIRTGAHCFGAWLKLYRHDDKHIAMTIDHIQVVPQIIGLGV